jgi:hypothetical protein
MSIQSLISYFLAIMSGISNVADYKPDRPNNMSSDGAVYNVEQTFTAPRGYIIDYGKSSILTLPDGRRWVIPSQTPGEYIDIRMVNGNFRGGTILIKGSCTEKEMLPAGFDISHCD